MMLSDHDVSRPFPVPPSVPPTLFDRRRRRRVTKLGTVKEESSSAMMDLPESTPLLPALADDILGHWILAALVLLAVAALICLVRRTLPAAVSELAVCCIHMAAMVLEGLIALNGLYLLQRDGLWQGGGFRL